MQAERDWLVKRVFPALRGRLEPYRIQLVDIDLRWGITKEQADNDQVLGLCLQQIDECRPFFLGLLGERYGWVPAVFPVEVGTRYGWTQHATGKSLTELEILHGVLNNPEMQERALFGFRSDAFLETLTEEQRRVYNEGPAEEELRDCGPEDAERRAAGRRLMLADLKDRIRALSPPLTLFDGYPCNWDQTAIDPANGEPGRIGGLTAFGDWVIDRLERAILDAPELREHLAALREETRDELAEERDFHERFIESRTRVYIGRQALQQELAAFAGGAEARPCLLTGPSGCGKSAALAKFISDWRATHPEDTVIAHFIGAGPRSTSLRELLRRLCIELQTALGLEEEIAQEIRELSDQFREFLKKIPPDRRIVMVIDGLNQLDETDNAHTLHWFPAAIPPQVRCIASCIDDPDRGEQPALAAMRRCRPHEIAVPLLDDDERLGIVRAIPSMAAKTLDDAQIALLLRNKATRNPLFLLVALEELRGFGSFEQLNRRITELPRTGDTLTEIFRQVIRRLETDFDTQTVCDVLTLLACSRRGLSERELLDLLEGRHIPIAESEGDLFPLLRQLRPYLHARGPQLDFFHRHLAKAIHAEYLTPDENLQPATHRRLADYFLGCARGDDPAHPWETDAVRGFAEGVFHRTRAGQYDDAAGLLADFPFLLHKLRSGLLDGVLEDYALLNAEAPAPIRDRLIIPSAFFLEKAHILRRGTEEWPTYKIFLQLAIEHADDSPLTLNAEAWLADDRCDWSWLRRHLRLPHAQQNPCLATLEGHTEQVNGALALADGRVLSWSWDGTLRVWDSQHGTCQAVFEGHTGPVWGALTLADGRVLSWAGRETTLRVWDGGSGVLMATLVGHTEQVSGALALVDGRLLSWSDDMTLRLWDGGSGTLLVTLAGHTSYVYGALVLANGRLLSWSSDKTLRVWDGASGAPLATLDGHASSVKGALELAGGRLLSWSDDGTLREWDGASGAPLATLAVGDIAWVKGALALADGRVLSWSYDNTLRVWDGGSGACLTILEGHTVEVNGALALADGRVLSWSCDATLRIWDSRSGACLATLTGHSRAVSGALVLADGRLLSWSLDGTLRVWDVTSGSCLAVLKGHSNLVSGIRVFSDGRILSWSWDGTLRVWDGGSGAPPATLDGHTDRVYGAGALEDGRVLSWSKDGTLRIWDGGNGACLAVLEGHTDMVWGALALADRRVLSCSGDGTLRVWDGGSGACLTVLKGHTNGIRGALALADGRLLSWSDDATLRLWDGHSGACLATLTGHTSRVNGAGALADGRLLSWSSDRTLRLWDISSGACLATLAGHTNEVEGAGALADGRLLSWAKDNTLRLWDGRSGAPLATLAEHTNEVEGARALADGRLLSWAKDGTLRVWDSRSGACLAVLEGHTGWIYGALALADGRLLSWSEDKTLRVWDGDGQPLGCHSLNEGLRLYPEFRAAFCGRQNVVSHAIFRGISRAGHLRCFPNQEHECMFTWHGDSECTARLLFPDGRAILTQTNGQVCVLQLYHGNRPISIAELEALEGE